IVDLAFGVEGLAADVARFATLEDPAIVELLVDPAVRRSVHTALRGHAGGARGAVPLLRGAEGSGRRALVGDAARELGARLLVVRCDDLPGDAALGGALVAILREAILERAIIVLTGVEALAEDAATGGAIARA